VCLRDRLLSFSALRFLQVSVSTRLSSGWLGFFSRNVIVEGSWELEWLGHVFLLSLTTYSTPFGVIFPVALYLPRFPEHSHALYLNDARLGDFWDLEADTLLFVAEILHGPNNGCFQIS
jgi:hypothetical protein